MNTSVATHAEAAERRIWGPERFSRAMCAARKPRSNRWEWRFKMTGFFRSLEPLLRFGLGLVLLAVLGVGVQAALRWIKVPLMVILVPLGVTAVVVTVLCVSLSRR